MPNDSNIKFRALKSTSWRLDQLEDMVVQLRDMVLCEDDELSQLAACLVVESIYNIINNMDFISVRNKLH